MDADQLAVLFTDRTGFRVAYDLLGIAPSAALQSVNDDGARDIYLLDGSGLWRVAESAPDRRKAAHAFTFAPFDSIETIVGTLTDAARDALAGKTVLRHYAGLMGAALEVRLCSGDTWTIAGTALAGHRDEDDPVVAASLGTVFSICRVASENGVAVSIVSADPMLGILAGSGA